MHIATLFTILGIVVVAAPATLLAVLGLTALVERTLSEQTIGRCTFASVVVGLLAAFTVLVMMLASGARHVTVELGDWMTIPQQNFHFSVKFVFDRLSMPMVILSFLLCGVVGAFTNRYLHREPGYRRFYVLYAIFLLGMIVSSAAGTIETLFLGWELVGLSSALLVAFFHERPAPVRNGLQVWSVYRIADAAFLVAAVAMHHMTGAGDFDGLLGSGPWPEGHASVTSAQSLVAGLLLLVAVAGKSALVPFSGWLPRAMEGPTASSAIFYGALSVHLGAFLLLRVSPLLEVSAWLGAAVVVLGLCTALYAAVAVRVQTDVKTALAFASLIQVGLIVAEIGFGLRYLALVHIIGHACLRTLQLLRAPNLLHDYHTLENAIGAHLHHEPGLWSRTIPRAARVWLYRFAHQRGHLDAMLLEFVVVPFRRVFQACDTMERRWTDLLSGGRSRKSDKVESHSQIVEELRL